ncbi:hypothetical protein AAHA92_20851 [Salvia divinorum]|uniref:Uncharacterized protein n=1 Tax=Salvia divinorum TaxID=28513 RepID=A0ABD1GIJ2_SALDI
MLSCEHDINSVHQIWELAIQPGYEHQSSRYTYKLTLEGCSQIFGMVSTSCIITQLIYLNKICIMDSCVQALATF